MSIRDIHSSHITETTALANRLAEQEIELARLRSFARWMLSLPHCIECKCQDSEWDTDEIVARAKDALREE